MNKKILPKLRFSDFTAFPKWDIVELGDLCIPITEKVGEKRLTLMSVTSGVGLVPQLEKFGREIAGNAYKNYYAIKKNDFAYNKSATKQYPEGYISMLTDYEEAALPNSIFTCFRITDKECNYEFFNQLFQNNYHGSWLRKYIEVGARAHGSLSIDNKYLWNMPVAIPKKDEQQKIADCLSSLDELIEAENRKLETLQKHKKGLMQKLFPSEGKSVPEWRFPEFKENKPWEKTQLGKIAQITIGEFVIKTRQNDNSPYPVYNGGTSYTGFYDEFNNEGNKILVSARGANAGFVNIVKTRYWAGNSCYSVDLFDKSQFDTDFIYQQMKRNQSKFIDNQQAANIPSVSKVEVEQFEISLPPHDEQIKITNCLSQIDNFILAQSQKIEKLKTHKKGLMQGLFPSVEEVYK